MTMLICTCRWDAAKSGHDYRCPVARRATATLTRIERDAEADRSDAESRRVRIGGQAFDVDEVPRRSDEL